jgi:Mlc titration factor MtfA (ptsG expression regulator)
MYFDHVLSILVYPDSYVTRDVEITRAGVAIEGGQARSVSTMMETSTW